MTKDIRKILAADNGNFFLIAGPCVVEGEEITLRIAREIKAICSELEIPFLFKASYKKANRSSLHSFTGIGNEEALAVLRKVKETLNVPIVTDIHTEPEAAWAAEVADVLQIPAFLCRQTDLLVAAAQRDSSSPRKRCASRWRRCATPAMTT